MTAAQRRDHLLEVARDVFTRDGYRSTTAQDVGERAGVSETLVLKHFGSKEALFRAALVDPLLHLIEAQNAQTRAQLEAGDLEPVSGQMAQVEAFLSTWATLVKEEGAALYVMLAELRDFPDVADRLASALHVQVEELISLARPFREAGGYLDFDMRVMTYASLAAATVAGIFWDDPDEFIREYLKVITRGILATPRKEDT